MSERKRTDADRRADDEQRAHVMMQIGLDPFFWTRKRVAAMRLLQRKRRARATPRNRER